MDEAIEKIKDLYCKWCPREHECDGFSLEEKRGCLACGGFADELVELGYHRIPDQTDKREAVNKIISNALVADMVDGRIGTEPYTNQILSLFPIPALPVLSEWVDKPDRRGEYWVSPFIDGTYIFPRILSVIDYERPDRGLEVQYEFSHPSIPVETFVRGYFPNAKWMRIKEPAPPSDADLKAIKGEG